MREADCTSEQLTQAACCARSQSLHLSDGKLKDFAEDPNANENVNQAHSTHPTPSRIVSSVSVY